MAIWQLLFLIPCHIITNSQFQRLSKFSCSFLKPVFCIYDKRNDTLLNVCHFLVMKTNTFVFVATLLWLESKISRNKMKKKSDTQNIVCSVSFEHPYHSSFFQYIQISLMFTCAKQEIILYSISLHS